MTGEQVTVVGGGVVGLAASYFLRRQGFAVTLVERSGLGRGASLGNCGWITPSLSAPLPAPGLGRYALRSLGRADSPLFIEPRFDRDFIAWLWRFWRSCNERVHRAGLEATVRLNDRTMELYDQLAADGVEFSMWNRGLLYAFLDERGAADELAKLRVLEANGFTLPATPLDGAEARELEPALSEDVRAAFLLQNDRHVDPETLTNGLAASLRESGAVIREGTEVTGFRRHGARVKAVQTTTGAIECDHVVIAAGAWAGEIARELGVHIPLEAGKGYSFQIEPESAPRHPLYLSDAKIGVSPMEGSRVRVAGTMELSGINLRLNSRRIDAMAAYARKFFATWPDAEVAREWVGMRPVSADGLPIIGKAGRFDNVFLATGHNMLGVTLAPATGYYLAEFVASGEVPDTLRPFTPARFVSYGRRKRVAAGGAHRSVSQPMTTRSKT